MYIQIKLDGNTVLPAESEEFARHIASYMRRCGHRVSEDYEYGIIEIISNWEV